MARLKITQEAKQKARSALELRASLPKSRKFGLSPTQAEDEGVFSGVSRARQIIANDTLSEADARRVAAFYLRFRNCRTPKCEGALNLWGGRAFGKMAVKFVRELDSK